jgi:uroporphyrinogen III methyltransferase/synthase
VIPSHVQSADKALSGRIIVITRPRAQAQAFADELESRGARVIVCPTIEIAELESYERVDEAIDHLFGFDWLIFTSANAVDHFFRRFNRTGHAIAECDDLRVCAIGEATAEKLQKLNIHVDVIPTDSKAEGVFAALEQFVGGKKALAGVNFLLPRAAVARDFLPRALEAAGARIDVVPVYKTVAPDVDRARLAAMLAGGSDCITFTSSSSVKNLAQLFDTQDLSSILTNTAIACIGEVTRQTAARYGLAVQIQPAQPTATSLIDAIVDYFAKE